MLFVLAAFVVVFAMLFLGGSRRPAARRPADPRASARPSRHQVYAMRIAPSQASPWSRRHAIGGGR
jgi:hypothetical protein